MTRGRGRSSAQLHDASGRERLEAEPEDDLLALEEDPPVQRRRRPPRGGRRRAEVAFEGDPYPEIGAAPEPARALAEVFELPTDDAWPDEEPAEAEESPRAPTTPPQSEPLAEVYELSADGAQLEDELLAEVEERVTVGVVETTTSLPSQQRKRAGRGRRRLVRGRARRDPPPRPVARRDDDPARAAAARPRRALPDRGLAVRAPDVLRRAVGRRRARARGARDPRPLGSRPAVGARHLYARRARRRPRGLGRSDEARPAGEPSRAGSRRPSVHALPARAPVAGRRRPPGGTPRVVRARGRGRAGAEREDHHPLRRDARGRDAGARGRDDRGPVERPSAGIAQLEVDPAPA